MRKPKKTHVGKELMRKTQRIQEDCHAEGLPFSINIDDANSAENCCIYLYPHNFDKSSDIEFTVKFFKNAQTGKIEYSIMFQNVKEVVGLVDKAHTPEGARHKRHFNSPERIVCETDVKRTMNNIVNVDTGKINVENMDEQSVGDKIVDSVRNDVRIEQNIPAGPKKGLCNYLTEDLFHSNYKQSIQTLVGNQDDVSELLRNPANDKIYKISTMEDHVPMKTNFTMMKLEEGYLLINQLGEMNGDSRAQVLGILIQIIEFEKNFVTHALFAKMIEERKFIQELLKAKEMRQNRFICTLLNSELIENETVFTQTVREQLDSENKFIFQKLNDKISHENNLLIETLKKEIKDNKEMLVKKSNKKCYQSLKLIMYRYLSEKLEVQIKQILEEVAFNLTREREIIINEINKKVLK